MMIAHIRSSDYEIQTVEEHAKEVESLAHAFGKKAGFSAMASLAGFLHDMGKNTEAFHTYIREAVLESNVSSEKIDHSTAGAKYLYDTYYVKQLKTKDDIESNLVIEIVGMVILSHHSGLQNFVQVDGKLSDYFRRVCEKELPYYEEVKDNFLRIKGNKEYVDILYNKSLQEMKVFDQKVTQLLKEQGKQNVSKYLLLSLALKFIFSCLIDADRTDARRFEEGDTSEVHTSNQLYFEKSSYLLDQQLKQWAKEQDLTNTINSLRSEMSEQCNRLAAKPSSIYTLSIPTGGGKTLASLRYALNHAQKFKKDRIIYVVPYTTIIEQNVAAVRKIIEKGEPAKNSLVLEHHANVIDDSDLEIEEDFYDSTSKKRMELARDNWDYPIIFTTMVQFLDAFYAKGTRKSRRLHNLANAVIIFDEVQSVPVKHIPLFNSAVNFLHQFTGSSILLCTATQPTLARTKYPLLLEENIEMIDGLSNVVKAFERVSITNKVTSSGWDAQTISNFAIEKLNDLNSMLIILNTKKAVLDVYEQLKDEQDFQVYHLSTSMCPVHRNDILQEIRDKLEEGIKVVCVSTQLIEAGVDISFESVVRSLAGLDSIAQAAGRCNRNKERTRGEVFIIRASEENLTKLPEIKLGQQVMEENILTQANLSNDLLSPISIQTYFQFFLTRAERELSMTDSVLNIPLIELIDASQKYVSAIPKRQSKNLMRSMFKTLENHFSVIEAPTVGVIVPYSNEGKDLIASLNEDIDDYNELNDLLKRAQLYSVNVYKHTLNELAKEDLIYPLYQEGVYALRENGYDEAYGVSLKGEGSLSSAIF